MISLIVEEGSTVRRLDFDALPVRVGRDDGIEVQVMSTRTSRLHARIEASNDGIAVVDLDSSNGTFKNGERVRRALVQQGDRIDVGGAVIVVVAGDKSSRPEPAPVAIPGFTILDDHGDGVRARVVLARQDTLDRKVAIKILKDPWKKNLAVATLFQRQARVQAKLHLQGLASGIDVGQADGLTWFVVEHLEGDVLKAVLTAHGAIDRTRVLAILEALLELLDGIHRQGQVAGHLSPARILLGDAGEVWLTSLGFPLPHTQAWPEPRFAELAVLPPEAPRAPESAKVPGDLFQLAAVGVWMLAGRPPRRSTTLAGMLAALPAGIDLEEFPATRQLPAALKAWFLRMLSIDPKVRPKDAEEAKSLLRAAMKETGPAPVRASPAARAAAPEGQSIRVAENTAATKPSKAPILAAAVILLLGAGAYFVFNGPEKPSPKPRIPPAAPVAVKQPDPLDVEAAARAETEVRDEEAFARMTADVANRLGLHQFPEALDLAGDFAKNHGGSRRAGEALDLISRIRRDRSVHARELVAEARARLVVHEVEQARAALERARVLADGEFGTELGEVDGLIAMEERVAAAAKAASVPAIATTPQEEPGGPKGSDAATRRAAASATIVGRQIDTAVLQPWDLSGHVMLLDIARRFTAAEMPPRRYRLLAAIAKGIGEIRDTWKAGVGKPIKLTLTDQSAVDGILKAVEDDALVIEAGGKAERVKFDLVPYPEGARILGALEGDLDRYICRGLLNVLAGRRKDAWFDFQAALLLAGNDADAREVIDVRLHGIRTMEGPSRGR